MQLILRTLFIFSSMLLIAACSALGDKQFETDKDRLTAGIFLDPEARGPIPAGVQLRPVYPKGIALTKVSEGFRHRLYNDAAGYCTIGYGHLIKKARCNGTEPARFRKGLTELEGEELLVDDMAWAQYAVMRRVNVDLTPGQYAALVDFVFNVGGGNFKRSTLLKVVNVPRFGNVPVQLRRWVRAGGKVWPGLKTRREREIELFFEGIGIPRARGLPAGVEALPLIDIRTGEPGI